MSMLPHIEDAFRAAYHDAANPRRGKTLWDEKREREEEAARRAAVPADLTLEQVNADLRDLYSQGDTYGYTPEMKARLKELRSAWAVLSGGRR